MMSRPFTHYDLRVQKIGLKEPKKSVREQAYSTRSGGGNGRLRSDSIRSTTSQIESNNRLLRPTAYSINNRTDKVDTSKKNVSSWGNWTKFFGRSLASSAKDVPYSSRRRANSEVELKNPPQIPRSSTSKYEKKVETSVSSRNHSATAVVEPEEDVYAAFAKMKSLH